MFFSLSFCITFETAFKVLLRDVNPTLSKSKHTRFSTHRLGLRSRSAVHLARDLLEIDTANEVHLSAMNLENVDAAILGRVRELDFTVDAARTKKRLIEPM